MVSMASEEEPPRYKPIVVRVTIPSRFLVQCSAMNGNLVLSFEFQRD